MELNYLHNLKSGKQFEHLRRDSQKRYFLARRQEIEEIITETLK